VVECTGEAADVSDDAAAHDEDGFVARDSVVAELDQDFLDVGDVFVDFVAVVDELHDLDAEVREVGGELLAVLLDDLVSDDGDAAAEGLLEVGEDAVGRVEHVAGDLDGGGERRGHHGFDGL